MKTVYALIKHNGTYEYVHAYVDEGFDPKGDGRVVPSLVPDSWGLPGFKEWTVEEGRLADALERIEAVVADALEEAADVACQAEADDAERYEGFISASGELGGEA